MYKIIFTNCEEWNDYLTRLPANIQDVYFTKEYYSLCEKNGDGKGRLFIYEDDEKIAMYSFLINEIEGYNLDNQYYDIETAYGYGGPLTNSNDKKFLNDFENGFLKYCSENNIIAEFIRFHPLIKNENIFAENITVLHNRITVYLDLTKGIDRIWNEDIKSKNRNMIRKAQKNNLKVEFSNDYNTFKNIYFKTMDKVKADNSYYFDKKYYEEMKKSDNYTLLNVKKDNITIASGIFIKYGQYFHYHLAGSLKEYLKYAPNNLLLWEAIKIACRSGEKYFHFGGGLSDDLQDNLFKFKNSFSMETANFYIGKRIHNNEIYNYLISEWEKKNNKKAKLFLQYKY